MPNHHTLQRQGREVQEPAQQIMEFDLMARIHEEGAEVMISEDNTGEDNIAQLQCICVHGVQRV